MSTPTASQLPHSGLPARRVDAAGVAHVELRAVLALAVPLVANSAVQTILNLTDLWFIGHISTTALAAVGAVSWLVIAVVLLLAGTGMAVQTCVAQCYGAGRYNRAAQATWTGLWGILCVAPLFFAVAFSVTTSSRHLASVTTSRPPRRASGCRASPVRRSVLRSGRCLASSMALAARARR